MARGYELEIHFEGFMRISSSETYARFEGDFTENPTELMEAQKKLRESFLPTSLEVHREEIKVATEEGDVELPILVYDVWWDHAQTALRPSFIAEPEPEDRVPTYPLNEYDVYIAE